MIRANLLPAPRESYRFLGANLERRLVREAAGGFVFLALVAAGAYGVEDLRLGALRAESERLELRVADNSARRREVAAAAADVARLQQLAREADLRRRSGNEVAATLIAIGNAMPARVWLDGIDRRADGFVVSGGALSLDEIGDTLVAVERAMPGYASSLTTVSREDNASALHFSVELRSPAIVSPVPPSQAR